MPCEEVMPVPYQCGLAGAGGSHDGKQAPAQAIAAHSLKDFMSLTLIIRDRELQMAELHVVWPRGVQESPIHDPYRTLVSPGKQIPDLVCLIVFNKRHIFKFSFTRNAYKGCDQEEADLSRTAAAWRVATPIQSRPASTCYKLFKQFKRIPIYCNALPLIVPCGSSVYSAATPLAERSQVFR